MKRILFLDDNLARLDWARDHLRGYDRVVWLVETAQRAVAALDLAKSEDMPFDEVYLDHDLGGEVFAPSDERSGMEVVRYMVRERPFVGKVVVHSMNTPAANEMVSKLRDAGYEAEYVMFLKLAGYL